MSLYELIAMLKVMGPFSQNPCILYIVSLLFSDLFFLLKS